MPKWRSADVKPPFDGGEVEAVDLHDFLSRSVAANHRHRSMGQVERLGKKLTERFVRLPFHRRRVNLHLKCITQPTHNL